MTDGPAGRDGTPGPAAGIRSAPAAKARRWSKAGRWSKPGRWSKAGRGSRPGRWPKGRRGPAGAASKRGPSQYRTAFFLLAAAGILAAVAWVLLGSRLLVVRSITVTGTHLVPKSEVLAAAGIPAGLPLIRVDTGAAASRIDGITQVQSAQVTRQWPGGVLIAVQERNPALAVPLVGGGFALVDPAGVVVQQVTKQPRGIPRFIPAGPLPGNPGVRAAASVLRQLPSGIAGRVTSVTVPTVDAVTLHLSGGITVDWGSSGQSAQKARVLAILMHTHARSFDVSAPGTATTG